MSPLFDIYQSCLFRNGQSDDMSMSPDDRHRIETVAWLEGAPIRVSRRLADAAEVQTYAARDTVFSAGQQPRFQYLILAGRLALIGEGAGAETVIEVFGEGEALLTPAVVLDRPYLLSARALLDTRVAAVPADVFRVMMDEEPALARAVINQLARHWRVLVRQLKDLKLRAGAQRLASYLLTQDRDRSGRVFLLMERRLLARRLGMTPEHLSRAFAQLGPYGVTSVGRAVNIADEAALRRFCDYDAIL